MFGDPDAADIVFTSGADVLAVGINVTHQVILTGNTSFSSQSLCFFYFFEDIKCFLVI